MTISSMRKTRYSRIISFCLIVTFVFSSLITPKVAFAQEGLLGLPQPGAMMHLSPGYVPLMIAGLTVHPDNPLLIDFIVSTGNSGMKASEVKKESNRLIKYFLASLTIPEDNQWVNLSPYEKNRIVPEDLGQTILGQDMMAQDYLLKQMTASLIDPQQHLGKSFWDKVYAKAHQTYGTTEIPINTFNKVWILPDTAQVYEHRDTVFVVKCHLKVMLEEDYLALKKHALPASNQNAGASQVVREVILPQLEKEVNQGKNFANLRQIYNSMILAVWFKQNLREAFLNQVYSDRSKVNGINVNDLRINEKIFRQYLAAYQKGVFNYIKEDADPETGKIMPRHYFSGGITPVHSLTKVSENAAMQAVSGAFFRVPMLAVPQAFDAAMNGKPNEGLQSILSEKLASAKDRLQPLLDAYYAAKTGGPIDEVKRLDGEINKIVDQINVYKQSKPQDLKLSNDVEPLSTFLGSPDVLNHQRDAKFYFLDGHYVPQFIFAGAATRLNRGPMYNLDIWDVAVELGKANKADAKSHLGMGPRQIIAYRLALEELAKQNGESPEKVLLKQKMIVDVNEDIEQTVLEDFIKNDFYGFQPENIYFITQPTFHGYKFQNGHLDFDPQSPTVPYGHGHNFMQLGEDAQAFTLSTGGTKNYLEGSLLNQFSNFVLIGSHRINDLTKLSKDSVVSVDKLAFAISKFAEGFNVVGELVDNPNKQKGGNVLKNTKTEKSFLIETSNVKGSEELIGLLDEAGQVGAPYNAFRLVYRVGALKRILQQKLPFNLRFKDGYFYLEAVTGDVTQMPETTAAFMSSGEEIHDFKAPGNIDDALDYLRQSDAQLVAAGIADAAAMRVEVKELTQTRPAKFGTSGDRGINDWDGKGTADFKLIFNMALVQRDVQGIAAHLLSINDHRPIIIGYDTRYRNPEYAKEAARILVGNGFKVLYVAQEAMPTPVLAILAANRDVAGVINFTASHGPWMDAGIKFSPSHGGAADKQTTDSIEQLANAAKEYKVVNYEEAVRDGQIIELDPQNAVDEYVNGYLVPTLKNTKGLDGVSAWDDIVNYIKAHPEFNLVLDPMQGTGVRTFQVLYGAIAEAVGRSFFRIIHTNNNDPEFKETGGAPQPAGKYIEGLLKEVEETPHSIGIAIDGDVDRFGVVDFGGKQFEANDMIAMFDWFLKKEIGLEGSLVTTVATSGFANAVADHLGQQSSETAVGFKWTVEKVIRGEKVLVGGEESAHVGLGPFMKSWDDGFAVGLTALWFVAKTGKTLAQYKREIEIAIGKAFVSRVKTIRDEKGEAKAKVIALISSAKEEIRAKSPMDIGLVKKAEQLTGQRIVRVNTMDGLKLVFESGDWILMRPSGTEPAAKLYVEVSNPERLGTMFKAALKLMGVDQAQLTSIDSNSFQEDAAPELVKASDRAALAVNGGIDLNAQKLSMTSSGEKVKITFNPAMIAQFRRGSFAGIRPEILDVTPIRNIFSDLGLKGK